MTISIVFIDLDLYPAYAQSSTQSLKYSLRESINSVDVSLMCFVELSHYVEVDSSLVDNYSTWHLYISSLVKHSLSISLALSQLTTPHSPLQRLWWQVTRQHGKELKWPRDEPLLLSDIRETEGKVWTWLSFVNLFWAAKSQTHRRS